MVAFPPTIILFFKSPQKSLRGNDNGYRNIALKGTV